MANEQSSAYAGHNYTEYQLSKSSTTTQYKPESNMTSDLQNF